VSAAFNGSLAGAAAAITTIDQQVQDFQITTRHTALDDLERSDSFDLQGAAILESIAEISHAVDKFRRDDAEAADDFACHEEASDEVLAEEDFAVEMFFE
jgi:hypothetical protein